MSEWVRKRWPAASSSAPEGQVVVDLAVEGDDHAAIGGRHRLGAAAEVHDRQPPVAEAEMRLLVEAGAVRAAVAQRVGHAPQVRALGQRAGAGAEQADDAAHQESPPEIGAVRPDGESATSPPFALTIRNRNVDVTSEATT